ncbi:NUDIX domain-containing protein [Xenorhabdus bovienii]|uniref:NUDIX domain-containing protein n=1 Tax=Xenorhabdus bovienii TaxID=40576 RepID=UPI003DA28D9B
MANFKEKNRGCVLLENEAGHYLFIKENNDDYWILPGGKKEQYESWFSTAERELREELGIESTKLSFRGMIENHFQIENTVYHETMIVFSAQCVVIVANHEKHIKRECRWVPPEALATLNLKPEPLRPLLLEKLTYCRI